MILALNLRQLLNGNKMRIALIFFFLVLLPATYCKAQPAGAVKEVIDGKEYYIHTVEKGETIYGISKKYNVKPDAIIIANPQSKDGIKQGDKLKIPVAESSTKVNPPVSTEEMIIHTVEKSETIYGITKKYGITEEELLKHNPDAKNGLSIGMQLRIPKKGKTIKETIVIEKPVVPAVTNDIVLVEHLVQKNETLYALSKKYQVTEDSIKLYNNNLPEGIKRGQTLIIPVKRSLAVSSGWTWYPDLRTMNTAKEEEKIKADEERSRSKKAVYNVALLLPFHLDKNSGVYDNTPKSEIFEPTRQSLDFYHGVLLAIDSLGKYGLSVNLYVHDIFRDSARISKFIKEPEFATLDLIIGPTDMIEQVALAAREFKIPLVCPFAYTNKILFENPYVSKAVTSTAVLIESASRFIVKNYGTENIILVDGRDKKDGSAAQLYHKTLNEGLRSASRDTVKYVKAESLGSKAWVEKLRKDKINVLVVPSNDFSFVAAFISNLNNTSIKSAYKDYKFVVFGTDEWLRYDDIDASYKVKFNLHIPASVNVNFSDSTIVPFIKVFRKKYGIDPDKYALMGYDIAWFYLSGYLKHGRDFALHLDEFKGEGLNTSFAYRRVNEESGFLNTHVYILKYDNFRLIRQE
jgi:LysM repeat protein